MTRVLFVIPGLGTGGAERSLVQELPGLVDRGVEPVVACFHERREGVHGDLVATGVPVHVIEGSRATRIRDLVALVRSTAPDLVHTSVHEADIAGRLAARLARTPVVSTLVNSSYEPIRLEDPNVNPASFHAHRVADIATARWCVGHRAISHAVKASAMRRLGIDSSTITVIPRGRDVRGLTFSPQQRAAARAALGVRPDDFVVGHVGRHEFQKGIDTLISAMTTVRQRVPSAVLVQAGREGSHSDAIRRATQASGLGPEVLRFLGHRPDVLTSVVPALDLFVFPSRYEGLGGAVLEATAAGLPVVASDLDVLREVLGNTAVFVPPDDPQRLASAIEQAALSAPDIPRQAAVEQAEQYDIRFITDRVAAWIHRAAATDVAARAPRSRAWVRTTADRVLSAPPVAAAGWRWAPAELRVLAYHGVEDAERFEQHLDRIAETAVPVGLSDVIDATNGRPLPERAVLLTFDDGDVSVLDKALGLLNERGIPSACFVIAGLVDNDEPFWWAEVDDHLHHGVSPAPPYPASSEALVALLKQVPDEERRRVIETLRASRGARPTQRNLSSADLVTMESMGMEIGNHTLTHPCLDRCERTALQREVAEGDTRLQAVLGHRVRAFAYPNGNVNHAVLAAVADVGYDIAFRFDHRVARLDRRLEVSRLRINASDSIQRLDAVLAGTHPMLHALRFP